MALKLPNDLISFHLRYDFAIECGYVDARRDPLSAAQILKSCRAKGVEPTPEQAFELNLSRRGYQLQRYYRYSVCARPGSEPLLAVTDGEGTQLIKIEGITRDLILRVSRSLGWGMDDPSPLDPKKDSLQEGKWVHGQFAVIHDVENARASILSTQAAAWYLAENRDARIR